MTWADPRARGRTDRLYLPLSPPSPLHSRDAARSAQRFLSQVAIVNLCLNGIQPTESGRLNCSPGETNGSWIDVREFFQSQTVRIIKNGITSTDNFILAKSCYI